MSTESVSSQEASVRKFEEADRDQALSLLSEDPVNASS
jgi:hypothetical protein